MVWNAERLIQNKMLCVDEYYPCKQVTLQSQKCILYSPQALPLNTPPLLSLRREKKNGIIVHWSTVGHVPLFPPLPAISGTNKSHPAHTLPDLMLDSMARFGTNWCPGGAEEKQSAAKIVTRERTPVSRVRRWETSDASCACL